mmetsp:Transcript_22755/g.35036  ORF Transcript_22755/g.35036 Transcript_22755/m.35036 type:complete len:122 (-) Transcript_22755:25-390(-)
MMPEEEEGGKLAYSKDLIERILTSICLENKNDKPPIKVYKNHMKVKPTTQSTKPSEKGLQAEKRIYKPFDTFSRDTKETERMLPSGFDLKSEFLNGHVSRYAGAREIEFKSRAAQSKQRVI